MQAHIYRAEQYTAQIFEDIDGKIPLLGLTAIYKLWFHIWFLLYINLIDKLCLSAKYFY